MPPTFIEYDPSTVIPQNLWPMERVRNDPLEVRVRSEELREYPEGAVLRREIFFTSHEFRGEKIRVAAHVALPQGKGPLPAMVQGAGNLDGADSFSRAHNVATIAIDRVGTGDTNGPGDLYNESWLDLGHDPRDGWMYQFVYNVLRAITYMQAQPEVDASRIAVTGGSRGGTMSLIANGVDPRITLAIPTATCGDILTAFDHDGWANHLYRSEDGEIGIPPKFRIFSIYGDPINLAHTQHGKVMLILGAQDEYFPICTVKSYCDAFTGDMRLCLVQDWDHGLFSADRPEVDTYDNREEAGKRTSAATKYAIECYLHQKRAMPLTPHLSWLYRDGQLEFTCTPDSSWPLEHVHLIYSRDGAYFFKRMPMEKIYETFKERYVVSLPCTIEQTAKLAFYVEAKYNEGPFLMSPPEFGLAFRQRMRQHAPRPPAPEPQFVTEQVSYGEGIETCVAFDRGRRELPVLVLLAPPEGAQLEINEEELKAEAERYSRRGLFAAAARVNSPAQVGELLNHLFRSYGEAVRSDAVSLIGYRESGALALKCSAEMPEQFRCVVAYSPHASAHDFAPAAQAAGNIHATQVRIFADLEDPSLSVGQSFANAAQAAGRRNVVMVCSHPTDGLRWSPGWPGRNSVLRRTEDRFANLLTAREGPPLTLSGAGQLTASPRVHTARFDVSLESGAAVVEYSIQGERLALRIQPAGSADAACTIALRNVQDVEHNGEPVETDPSGHAQFFASAGSTINARILSS